MLVAAAIASVPGSVALSFLTRDEASALSTFFEVDETDTVEADAGEQFAVIGLQVVTGSLSLLVVAAVVAHLVAGTTAGVAAPDGWGSLVRRVPALVGAWVLVHLVQLAGIATAGVLTVAALVWFVPVTPIVVMERVGPVAAMKRARALVQRRWWPVAGHVLLVALISTVLGTAIVTVPDELGRVFLDDSAWIVSAAANVLAGIVTTSVVAGATVALYLDLRIRREGLDLTARLDELVTGAGR